MSNPHKKARLPPAGRAVLVRRVLEERRPVPEVAAGMGISARTAWKWLARDRAAGPAGLENRSSRPRRSPRALSRARQRQIRRLRLARRSSLHIARHLRLPFSTVVTVPRRLGLARLPRLTPPVPLVRSERARPGELLPLDIKRLGQITRVGHRIHGDRTTRARGAGWEYRHVAVDDHSRLPDAELHPDQRGATAVAFLQRAAAWFRGRGIARVERVITDNGSACVSHRFRAAVRALGARHLRTRPDTPRTNGKVERLIQTLLREWASARPYASSLRRSLALEPSLAYYNTERPHTALGFRPPLSRLAA